jgi:hypothetical protein
MLPGEAWTAAGTAIAPNTLSALSLINREILYPIGVCANKHQWILGLDSCDWMLHVHLAFRDVGIAIDDYVIMSNAIGT